MSSGEPPEEFWDDLPEESFWKHVEKKHWQSRLWLGPSKSPSNPYIVWMWEQLKRIYPLIEDGDWWIRRDDEKLYRDDRRTVEKAGGSWKEWVVNKIAELDTKASQEADEEAEWQRQCALETALEQRQTEIEQQRRERMKMLEFAADYRSMALGDYCCEGFVFGPNYRDYQPGGRYYEEPIPEEWVEKRTFREPTPCQLKACEHIFMARVRRFAEFEIKEFTNRLLKEYDRQEAERIRAEDEARRAEWRAICAKAVFSACISPDDPYWTRRGKVRGWVKKCEELGIMEAHDRIFTREYPPPPQSFEDFVQQSRFSCVSET